MSKVVHFFRGAVYGAVAMLVITAAGVDGEQWATAFIGFVTSSVCLFAFYGIAEWAEDRR